jgi:hypothetical protein
MFIDVVLWIMVTSQSSEREDSGLRIPYHGKYHLERLRGGLWRVVEGKIILVLALSTMDVKSTEDLL